MLLYHGTSFHFVELSLNQCKLHRDFGCGFYTACDYFDALPMAIRHSDFGYVTTFELANLSGLNVLELDGYSEEWIRFVIASRLGDRSNYDLVIGNTAGGGRNLKRKFAEFRRSGTTAQDVVAIIRKQLTSTDLGI